MSGTHFSVVRWRRVYDLGYCSVYAVYPQSQPTGAQALGFEDHRTKTIQDLSYRVIQEMAHLSKMIR